MSDYLHRENLTRFGILPSSPLHALLFSESPNQGHILLGNDHSANPRKARRRGLKRIQDSALSRDAVTLLGLALRKLDIFGSTVIFYRAFPDNCNHIAAFIEEMRISEADVEKVILQWLIELGRKAIKRPDCPDGPSRNEFVLIGFLIERGLETESTIRERLGWEDLDVSRARRESHGLVEDVMRQLHESMLPQKSSRY